MGEYISPKKNSRVDHSVCKQHIHGSWVLQADVGTLHLASIEPIQSHCHNCLTPCFQTLDRFVIIITLPNKCLHCGGFWKDYSNLIFSCSLPYSSFLSRRVWEMEVWWSVMEPYFNRTIFHCLTGLHESFQTSRSSSSTPEHPCRPSQYLGVFGRWGKLSKIIWLYIIAILNQRFSSLLCARSIEAKQYLWPYLSF